MAAIVQWFFLLQETQEYTRNVVRYCLEALQDWFDAINFVDEVCINGFKQGTVELLLNFKGFPDMENASNASPAPIKPLFEVLIEKRLPC